MRRQRAPFARLPLPLADSSSVGRGGEWHGADRQWSSCFVAGERAVKTSGQAPWQRSAVGKAVGAGSNGQRATGSGQWGAGAGVARQAGLTDWTQAHRPLCGNWHAGSLAPGRHGREHPNHRCALHCTLHPSPSRLETGLFSHHCRRLCSVPTTQLRLLFSAVLALGC